MFTIKKTRKPGQCSAMRCQIQCTPGHSDLLCEKHEQEWLSSGSPALTSESAPLAKSDDISPQLVAKLDAERAQAQEALQLVMALPVETEEERTRIGEYINLAGAKVKELEAERTSYTGPLNAVLHKINGQFKPITEFYGSIQRALKDKLAAKLVALEAERAAALKLVAENPTGASAETFAMAHAERQAPSNVGVRRRVLWRMVDSRLLPEEYTMRVPFEAKIAAQVSMDGLKTSIPGIEVYEDVDVTAGRAS